MGIALGWALPSPGLLASGGETEREQIGLQGLTSPYLECAGVRDLDPALVRARDRTRVYLRRIRASDPTLEVSVYARDLLNGPWIGIDERKGYEPASLMKVWVLFHSLARLESDPALKDREYVYPGPEAMPSPDNLSDRPAEERMVPGASYRYEELVERMVIYSDNHAKDLLLSDTSPREVEDFMEALGMKVILEGGVPVMNARSYAALFRILYNSSVFSRPTSNWALGLLTLGRYREALRAPIPEGVLVASKFGIFRGGEGANGGSHLHEAGIIYAPGGPYVLSVMTRSRAQTTDQLASIVAEISRILFETREG